MISDAERFVALPGHTCRIRTQDGKLTVRVVGVDAATRSVTLVTAPEGRTVCVDPAAIRDCVGFQGRAPVDELSASARWVRDECRRLIDEACLLRFCADRLRSELVDARVEARRVRGELRAAVAAALDSSRRSLTP